MSEKNEKRIRRIARFIHKSKLGIWERNEPLFLRFIAHRKWKNSKPDYKTTENFVRERFKK